MEMNLHMSQSETTKNEIWYLARAPTQIISPQTNAPIIGIVQDSLCGAFIMTRASTKISKSHFMNILSHNPNFNGKINPYLEEKHIDTSSSSTSASTQKLFFTGREAINTILPPINLQKITNSFDSSYQDKDHTKTQNEEQKLNSYLVIKNGKMVSGNLDKASIGASKENTIQHLIVNDYNCDTASYFLSTIQKYVNQFLIYRGFTVGLDDILPSSQTRADMDNEIKKNFAEVSEIFNKIKSNEYIVPVDTTPRQFAEAEITTKMNNIRQEVAGIMMKTMNPETNGLMGMVQSGSKGKVENVGQMSGAVGQQIVQQQRIADNYGNYRTLPCYQKFSQDPVSKGFVEHSFVQGLSAPEFFFHAMSGREGIIDTAIGTADSGYTSRRFMKAMEDIMVGYDLVIRNSFGQIVQFMFGEDGFDVTKIEKQRLETLYMSNKEMEKVYKFTSNFSELKEFIKPDIYKSIHKSQDSEASHILEYNTLITDRDYMRKTYNAISDITYAPVNIRRIIVNAINNYTESEQSSTLTPHKVVTQVTDLIDNLSYIYGNQNASDEVKQKFKPNFKEACKLLLILIRSALASKRVITEYKLSQTGLTFIINTIKTKFASAILDPGEMIGVIASQSLGEPSTQLTLNTFHSAGIASQRKVTAGVPRLKEIIDNRKLDKQKNPTTTLYIKGENKFNKYVAESIKNELKLLTLSDFVSTSTILFDPLTSESSPTKYEPDSIWMKDYFKYNIKQNKIPKDLSNIVIRLVLNKKALFYNQINMTYILNKLGENNEIFAMGSNDNSPEQIVRIYTNLSTTNESNPNNISQIQDMKQYIIEKYIIRGIKGIYNVHVRENPFYIEYDPTTGEPIKKKEYILETDGINLGESLIHPLINSAKFKCSDINEVHKHYGVEAARNTIIEEVKQVLDNNGIYVNYHNIALLADVMTRNGTIITISRHGFNKHEKSPISRATFEQTDIQLKNTALYGEQDKLKSVSARILFAQSIKGGTGFPELFIDEEQGGVSIEDIDNLLGN